MLEKKSIIKRINNIIEGRQDEVTDEPSKEEKRTAELCRNKYRITDPDLDSSIRDSNGDVVAAPRIKGMDPTTLELEIELLIPWDLWGKVEVVCDGNALDVDTEPLPDGRYKIRKKINGYRPAIIDREDVVELPKFATTKEFISWLETLDIDNVRAFRQIYYDKWNFDSGETKDRIYYELLDEEYEGRKK